MSERIKFSIQLSHSDGLWVEHVCTNSLKRHSAGRCLSLESRESIFENLVALCLPRDCGSHQHEPVADNRRLVELDALVDEPLDVFKAFTDGALSNARLKVPVINWLLR